MCASVAERTGFSLGTGPNPLILLAEDPQSRLLSSPGTFWLFTSPCHLVTPSPGSQDGITVSYVKTRETEAERDQNHRGTLCPVHVYSRGEMISRQGSQSSGVFWGLLKSHLWSVIPCPVIMKTPLTLGSSS